MDEKKLIDLDSLFRAKNPGLYKWIPAFVMRFLKRIVHQNDTNKFLTEHKNDNAFEFCKGVIQWIDITFDVNGLENVPKTGGCILACNHPMGALEALCMVNALHEIRTDMKFIVNDLLLNLENLKDIFVGVNKYGKASSDSLKTVNELFSSNDLILVFPAGLVSRKSHGVIEDPEWKKTFISRAKKFNKPVIPVFINGRNSNFFYNLFTVRKFLGIKVNLEMIFLVDEMYRQKGKHISIVFGNIIEPVTFTKLKTDEQWAAYVKQEVYKLKQHIK
jgi:putative hemolysin